MLPKKWGLELWEDKEQYRKRLSTAIYSRCAIFSIEEVLGKVFTAETRKKLIAAGHSPKSKEWQDSEIRTYEIVSRTGQKQLVRANMNSSRLLTFLQSGLKCHGCGIEGKFFALERDIKQPYGSKDKYHFNLYAVLEDGSEVLMTKDHIIPKGRGGANRLKNYQTMCIVCNNVKGAKRC